MLVRTLFRRFTALPLRRLSPFRMPIQAAVRIRPSFKLTGGMRSLHKLTTQPTEHKQFHDPFTYIRKNTIFPNLLNSINPVDPRLEKLRKAIESGNDEDPIFSDRDCHLLLLHLIKEKMITFDHGGLTVHVYLMALMQSTSKQTLKFEDLSLKIETPVLVDKLVANGKLTTFGNYYLKELCHRFGENGFQLIYSELEQFVLSLPAVEQWILRMRYDRSNHNHALVGILIKNIPFLCEQEVPLQASDDSRLINYFIPSTQIIKYLIGKISPEPLQGMPIYGNIGKNTLLDLHQRNLHPLPLYSPHVKNNTLKVHEYVCGPIPALMHDWGHIVWGSLLKAEEREKLFKHIIPQLSFLKDEAYAHRDRNLEEAIDEIIEKANDFNLTPIEYYIDPRTRFTTYLQRIFNTRHIDKFYQYWISQDPDKFYSIGDIPQDSFLFWVNRLAQDSRLTKEEQSIWSQLANLFNEECRGFKRDDVVDAIINAAKDNMMPCDNQVDSVDEPNWEKWLKLLTDTKDSQELWNQVKTKYHSDLLTLSRCYHLNYFHPYLPMTDERRKMFIDFFQAKIEQQDDYQNRLKR